MKLKHALLAAALAAAPLVSASPSTAGVVAVGVGMHPGHYCGWHHACWRYRWRGGYYNYYWHGRYWRDRYTCRHHWCYR
jgi:hypothetical protein